MLTYADIAQILTALSTSEPAHTSGKSVRFFIYVDIEWEPKQGFRLFEGTQFTCFTSPKVLSSLAVLVQKYKY